MDDYRATEFVKGLEASKVCLAKYYSVPENTIADIDKALDEFLKKNNRREVFNRIIKMADTKTYGANPDPCYDFFPPVVCVGEEKCEHWTR